MIVIDGAVHALDGQSGKRDPWPPNLDKPDSAVTDWYLHLPAAAVPNTLLRSTFDDGGPSHGDDHVGSAPPPHSTDPTTTPPQPTDVASQWWDDSDDDPGPARPESPTLPATPPAGPPAHPDSEPKLPARIGANLILGGMDVVEKFDSGDAAVKHIKVMVLREADATTWENHRERITGLFSDGALRPKVSGMLRGGRQLTHVIDLGLGRGSLTIDLRVVGAPTDSGDPRLKFKAHAEAYEFDHSSKSTNIVGSLSEGRSQYFIDVQGNVTHPNTSDTPDFVGIRERLWALTGQRADRQVSGAKTIEPGTRFGGTIDAVITHLLSKSPDDADVHTVTYDTEVVVPTRDVTDQADELEQTDNPDQTEEITSPHPTEQTNQPDRTDQIAVIDEADHGDEARDTVGPLPDSSQSSVTWQSSPPRVVATRALSGSDVVTNVWLSPSVQGQSVQSVNGFVTGATMRAAFAKAYGKLGHRAMNEVSGWLTVERLQANLHAMTNKQPLIHEFEGIKGARLVVHAFVEPLEAPVGHRDPTPEQLMRPTGQTASTEFHHGTETDTSEVHQDQLTWSGQLPAAGWFRGQAGTDVGQAVFGWDGTYTPLSRTRNDMQSRQFGTRNTLDDAVPGQSWHGQVRLRFEMHALKTVSPLELGAPFKGAVVETRGRFDVLMEQSASTRTAGYLKQTVWAPPPRIWGDGPPAQRNSVATSPWWRWGVGGRTVAGDRAGQGPRPAYQPTPAVAPRGAGAAPLQGLGSMDRVINLDLSGFHGMLEAMGRRAFGGDWAKVRSGVSRWHHLNRIRAALPEMTQHSPLTRTALSGPGSATKSALTADITQLTFQRVITPAVSRGDEFTEGAATTTTRNWQLSQQGVLAGRGGDVAGGGPVQGDGLGGFTASVRDGDRERNQERVVVATKFDQPMAIFEGLVRLDATLTGSKATVHDSGLFPVELAIPLTELTGSRKHDHTLPPTFTRENPTGFIDHPPATPKRDLKDLAPLPRNPFAPKALGHQGPVADKPTNKLRKPRPPSGTAEGGLDSQTAIEMEEFVTQHPSTAFSTPAALTDVADGTAPPRPLDHLPRPPLQMWSPQPPAAGSPQPPVHALRPAWHPSDVLVSVDPASALMEAIRHDLGPALGSGLDDAMAGVSAQFGPHVLRARLTHESGQQWSHDIPALGGKITVNVRPVREAQQQFVGSSTNFEKALTTESESAAAHIHTTEVRKVWGGRLNVPFPHGSVTVQVNRLHSLTVGDEEDVVEGIDHDELADVSGPNITGETEQRIPVRVKIVEPHHFFQQPIRFDISYEKHLGAKLLTSVPSAPDSVRVNGVFAYPQHTPVAGVGTDRPLNLAAQPPAHLDVEEVTVAVRPHLPGNTGAAVRATLSEGTDRHTPGEDLLASHVLDSISVGGKEAFGGAWPKVRAELAPHLKTMAVQRSLGSRTRGGSKTIDLTSVRGGKVVLGAQLVSVEPAANPAMESTAITEFSWGGIQSAKSGVSDTLGTYWQAYVQAQADLLPTRGTVNVSALGRMDVGTDTETVFTRTETSATGLLLTEKVRPTIHVGTAKITARMSRPISMFSRDRYNRFATAQVDFTTVKPPKNVLANQRYVPRPGIIQHAESLLPAEIAYHDADGSPDPARLSARGLSGESIVHSITDGDNFRAKTMESLRINLSALKMARIHHQVFKSLNDTRLSTKLAAMTQGEDVELLRHGSLRLTAHADIQDMKPGIMAQDGGRVNVLNEVTQVRVREPYRAREIGARFQAGPHWALPNGIQADVVIGPGGFFRERLGSILTQEATVAANGSFPSPYVTFDATTRIVVTVHDGTAEHVLPGVDVHGAVLIPLSETQKEQPPQAEGSWVQPDAGAGSADVPAVGTAGPSRGAGLLGEVNSDPADGGQAAVGLPGAQSSHVPSLGDEAGGSASPSRSSAPVLAKRSGVWGSSHDAPRPQASSPLTAGTTPVVLSGDENRATALVQEGETGAPAPSTPTPAAAVETKHLAATSSDQPRRAQVPAVEGGKAGVVHTPATSSTATTTTTKFSGLALTRGHTCSGCARPR